MNVQKRIGILVIVLIFVVIILLWLIPALSNTYTYTNPSGEKFTFTKSRIGDLTMHTLTAYATYRDDNTKKNYQYAIPLRNGPKSLENIQVQKNINNKILNKKYIYITLDPNLKGEAVIASIEIAKVLGESDYGVFKIPTQGALTYATNKTNSTQVPIINCNNANKDIGVIWLKLSKENKIYSNKECVILEAIDYKNLIMEADRLVYNLLGIM